MSLTSGILIDTLFGPKLVETLCTGDPVLTAEGSIQMLDTVVRATFAPERLGRSRHKPVLIRRNAFGRGNPSRDMLVSPGQKVNVAGYLPRNAASLIDDRRIVAACPRTPLTFIELRFSCPCNVVANGTPVAAKSGPAAPKRLTRKTRPALSGPSAAALPLFNRPDTR